MIGIVNYGMGNLASVFNALEYIKVKCCIISNPQDIAQCDKIILPGVGAFGQAMSNIRERGYGEEILEFASARKKPILGICLGMQLLLDTSYEFGKHEGLHLIKGNVLPFRDKVRHNPIPHVGWNTLEEMVSSYLLEESLGESFYFVHSYYCDIKDDEAKVGTTEYEIKFHSCVEKENIFGVQFHPEKSQRCGLKLFQRFSMI